MWHLKKNNTNSKIETDLDIEKKKLQFVKQTSDYNRWIGKVGGANQRHGIKRYKLLCIKQISNTDMLYRRGNQCYYLAIIFNGAASIKNTESLYCRLETNTVNQL